LNQLKEILKAAITHDGFAYVEVLQHCPTYNKFQDQTWLAQRVYDIKSDPNHKNERRFVYDLVDYSNEKIATGILYQDPNSVSFYNRQTHRKSITTTLRDEVKVYDISALAQTLA
jgi:2-oxoglutarate ferredoxin oxidoreductase subunit beta